MALVATLDGEPALFDPDAANCFGLPPERVTEIPGSHHEHLDEPARVGGRRRHVWPRVSSPDVMRVIVGEMTLSRGQLGECVRVLVLGDTTGSSAAVDTCVMGRGATPVRNAGLGRDPT